MTKKYIIIPDSFKGTLSASEVSSTIAKAILSKDSSAIIREIPMADGGEGTCNSFAFALGGEIVNLSAKDSYGQIKDTFYWRKGKKAVIEMAAICGYEPIGKSDPSIASTFGVGQLIKHALDSGCNQIVLGLGGSATNDGGAGMISALGGRFSDRHGRSFIPTGSNLSEIAYYDGSPLEDLLQGVTIKAMCDVTNPLHGPNGAAYVFAPQKGADPSMVKLLDKNLECYGQFIKTLSGRDVSTIPGSGAAGGMGAGSIAFLEAQLVPGAQVLLDMVNFDQCLENCDIVITGEGSLDEQSLKGKVVSTVTSAAFAKKVPVIAVVGRSSMDEGVLRNMGILKVIESIKFCSNPYKYEKTAREDLYRAVAALI